jgi:hypothetical protein
MVLDQAGGEVPVSTSNFWWQRGALPGDFRARIRDGHPEPVHSDLRGARNVIAVVTVGPYEVRRTVTGEESSRRRS